MYYSTHRLAHLLYNTYRQPFRCLRVCRSRFRLFVGNILCLVFFRSWHISSTIRGFATHYISLKECFTNLYILSPLLSRKFDYRGKPLVNIGHFIQQILTNTLINLPYFYECFNMFSPWSRQGGALSPPFIYASPVLRQCGRFLFIMVCLN